MRNAVFANRNFNLHSRVIHFTQNFFDATDGLPKQARHLSQFDDNDLPNLGIARRAFGNKNVLAIAPVFRGHQPDTAFL